jgi:hypothetical protein
MYSIGVDPGLVNGGFSVLNNETLDLKLVSIDFLQQPNPAAGGRIQKVKYDEKHTRARAHAFVDAFAENFGDASFVGVEKQMTRPFLVFAAHVESYVAGRFPGTPIASVSQRTVRAILKSSDADYETRKGMGALAVDSFIGAEAVAQCKARFYKGDHADRKGGPGHVDPQDAAAIAICGHLYRDRLMALASKPLKFLKKQKRLGGVPVRAVYVPRIDIAAGLAAVAERERRGLGKVARKRRRGDDGGAATVKKRRATSTTTTAKKRRRSDDAETHISRAETVASAIIVAAAAAPPPHVGRGRSS